MLFQFKSAEDLAQWKTFSDAELGGQSTSTLQLAEEPPVRGLACSQSQRALLVG